MAHDLSVEKENNHVRLHKWVEADYYDVINM